MRLLSTILLFAFPLQAFADEDAPTQPPQPPAPKVIEQPLPAPPPPVPPAPELTFKVFGYLRLKGAVIEDDPNVAFVGRNDGFVLQNARLGVEGTWRDKIYFRLSADGAVDEREGANQTEGTLRVGLKDAFVDLRLLPALEIRAVRFEVIDDLEDVIPDTQRMFVDRALESRGVLTTEGYEVPGLSPGRSIGVAVRSEHVLTLGPAHLGYEVAAQNGNGEYESENDSDSVALSGALMASVPGRFFAFVSGRHKTRSVGALPLRQTEEDWAGAAGLILHLGPVELDGQIMGRHTEFPTTGGPSENSIGGHAQVGLELHFGQLIFTPAYRWAIYDPSDLIDTDLVQEHTFGVTFALRRWPVRLQLNYTFAIEQAGRELQNDRAEACFEVAL